MRYLNSKNNEYNPLSVNTSKKRHNSLHMDSSVVVVLFLVLSILIVYLQVVNHEFINFDDDIYIINNSHVKAGLTAKSIKWSFTTIKAEFWHPLTWLSYMLDTQLYGVNPGGYLFTNLLLHVFNTLLLFFIIKWMTGSLWHSCFIAVLFAIHPLHVESVAWISERKDVLSTFFWMITMLCYLNFVKQPGIINYLFVCVCFILGLMAKPMLVTLPFVFLLLDYWPLGRIKMNGGSVKIGAQVKGLIWEKMPLFALSTAVSILALLAQKGGGGIGTVDAYPINIRIANAFISYVSYLVKTIWPYNLAFFYPSQAAFPIWQVAGSFILIVLISLTAIRLAVRYPYFFIGWLWYLGTLVPVIGLVKIGATAMADRYTYISLIGIFIIIAWGVPDFLRGFRWKSEGLFASMVFVLLVLMITARLQTEYWANSTRLFEHAIDVTNGNYMAYSNLGNVNFRQGRIDEAIVNYKEALRIKPLFPEALNGMGGALVRKGKLDQAVIFFQKALQVMPDNEIIRNNLNRLLAFKKIRQQTIADNQKDGT